MDDNEDLLVGYHNLIAGAACYDRYARAVVDEVVRLYIAAGEPLPRILQPFASVRSDAPELDA